MSEKLILEKLDSIEKNNDKLSAKVDRIESTISLLAVQTERLDNITIQVKAVWDKYDEAFKPGGYVETIKAHQAGCPKEAMKSRFKELWAAYALLTTIIIGCVWHMPWGKV